MLEEDRVGAEGSLESVGDLAARESSRRPRFARFVEVGRVARIVEFILFLLVSSCHLHEKKEPTGKTSSPSSGPTPLHTAPGLANHLTFASILPPTSSHSPTITATFSPTPKPSSCLHSPITPSLARFPFPLLTRYAGVCNHFCLACAEGPTMMGPPRR